MGLRPFAMIVRQSVHNSRIDVTTAPEPVPAFGSDAIALLLRQLGIPWLAINPGASFRGLHDSVVNLLGNRDPRLLLTLHEAQAVAIAHGYAKVTGQPMGVVLHANVGLMNAVMAIYNAWADRVPMLILGATGAVDAARRRPWIEWIHTSRDPASMVRPFLKWDDQPASVPAAAESLLRAWLMTRTEPQAPVYICLDVDLQERALPSPPPAPLDVTRFAPAGAPQPSDADVVIAQRILESARRPLVLVGRHRRDEDSWRRRIGLVESLGAAVICDQKSGVGFPSTHPRFVAAPAQYFDARSLSVLNEADAVLSLDWPDLAGTLAQRQDAGRGLKIIVVSPDERLHNGWSLDHFPLPQADVRVPVHPDAATAVLTAPRGRAGTLWPLPRQVPAEIAAGGTIDLPALAHVFERVRGERLICITRLPFGWPEGATRFSSPLDCIGYDGGGGIGSTPGITVGAALGLRGSGRLPVAILGDGDLLMGSQALWTAAAERLPALFIVNNNRSFYNDVEHQERVAKHRGRPVENRNIGMAISDPDVDLCALARSYGLKAFGPILEIADLPTALEAAFAAAEAGAPVLVDVVVPRG
jgi:thiamine pyrophosphate-dependent acetolactate synthase large subunit-like protein